MTQEPRFTPIENSPDFPADGRTCWYWDTWRPLEATQRYVAVQCYRNQDPNDYVPIPPETLRLLFTDQAEYCAVCPQCYEVYAPYQWSGSTQTPYWRKLSKRYLERHRVKGWCEFCDPVFGNGGWILPDIPTRQGEAS